MSDGVELVLRAGVSVLAGCMLAAAGLMAHGGRWRAAYVAQAAAWLVLAGMAVSPWASPEATASTVEPRGSSLEPQGSGLGPIVSSSISKVYHRPGCTYCLQMEAKYRQNYATTAAAEAAGKRPCRDCWGVAVAAVPP